MNRFTWPLILAVLICFTISSPSFSADYLDNIKKAITSVELDSYDEAASAADKALGIDDSDPLAHYMMGIVYLHTRNIPSAEKEFKKILSVKPDDWRAQYAMGVLCLIQKKQADADKYFTSAAKKADAVNDVNSLRNYLAYMKGQTIPANENKVLLPLALEVQSMIAFKQSKDNEAINMFEHLLQFPAPPGFSENKSPVATFDTALPIILPKAKLTWRSAEHKNAPMVSGIVTLKADAKKSSGIEFVSVYIDDSFIGVTNFEPFAFEWDTRRYPNGVHQVRMEGKDTSSNTVSTKTIWANVKNQDTQLTGARTGPDVDELYNRIFNFIRVSESRKIAHYHLAKLYIKSGNTEKAIKELEYVEGYQPGYMDSTSLLKSLRGQSAGYREITQGKAGSKLIALTFDDGPNERTSDMLDMLNKLQIPATFFLVGYVAETQVDMVKRIQSEGHEIENHTYSHRRLNEIPAGDVESELTKGAAVLRKITGQSTLFFRPPGGHSTDAVKKAAERQGLTSVFWTISCSPYEGANYDALASFVINNASDGAIVAMHNGEPATTSALPKIVSELKAQGYQFVTLSDIVSGNPSQLARKAAQ